MKLLRCLFALDSVVQWWLYTRQRDGADI